MRPEWSPNTVSGRMLADYLSVHYAGDRPLAVWILASEPVGSEPATGGLRDSRLELPRRAPALEESECGAPAAWFFQLDLPFLSKLLQLVRRYQG